MDGCVGLGDGDDVVGFGFGRSFTRQTIIANILPWPPSLPSSPVFLSFVLFFSSFF